MSTTTAPGRHARAGEAARAARRAAILALVEREALGSQVELAARLRAIGFPVTQATVSRDITDLGLVKAARGDRHAYVLPRTLAAAELETAGAAAHPGEARLRRILADYPVRVARSGLSLVLISTPGTASVIAQAIDESSLDDQVGTLAGDNTLLVLFADEAALERWRARFGAILQQVAAGLDGADLTSTYP
jgi:transcriptional regulator of arginine metabolism